jgi:hypothetical protein
MLMLMENGDYSDDTSIKFIGESLVYSVPLTALAFNRGSLAIGGNISSL